ncbi:MAG: acetylglutamate kinase [bacterium]
MERLIERAHVLIEALPYIQRFTGKTVVIKYGGAAMVHAELKDAFVQDLVLLQHVGIRPVVVHGGGPQINDWLAKLAIPSEFVDGIRVTSPEAMEVVEMVLVGHVNRTIVQKIQSVGGRAVGLSGKDGGLVRARKAPPKQTAAGPRDMGQVGEVVSVDPRVIDHLDEAGFIPVIAPVAGGEDGQTLNLNADTFASALARALRAEKLMLITDVEGVRDAEGKKLQSLTADEARALIAAGTAKGGMIPKLLAALVDGVHQAHVIDGRVPHAVLLEIFTDRGIGTLITP